MKTYIQPSMVVVRLLHSSIICTSGDQATTLSGNSSMSLGGNDASYVEGGGDVRVKEQSAWDEEW